jgi:hypothetical protein
LPTTDLPARLARSLGERRVHPRVRVVNARHAVVTARRIVEERNMV